VTNPKKSLNSIFKLGPKVAVCVALVQVPLMIVAAMFHISQVREDYLETVSWRSQALGQHLVKRVADLSGYSPEMQRTLGLNIDCKELLKNNMDDGLVHVGVISTDGRVIAHTDSHLIGKLEHVKTAKKTLSTHAAEADLNAGAYDTLIPVTKEPNTNPIATIDIGFSRAVIDNKVQNIIIYATIAAILLLITSFLLIGGLLRQLITKPISELSEAAAQFAQGNLHGSISVKSHDEVGSLAESLIFMQQAILQQIEDLNTQIEDREHAQQLLRKSEENLRTTLDSIGDGVIATDIEGNITRMNPVAEKLTSWTLNEAKSKPLKDVFNILNTQTNNQVEDPV